MLSKIRIIIMCLIVAGTFSCSLSGKTNEVVLAPTEVGTPEGPAATKDIGPAGGTLASPDGRFTLTVPQNALAEATTFSIQSITNALKTGLGKAYRFGPDGKTFAIPLELAVRYDEHDIEGTVPEALAVAFQDSDGSWHILKPKSFDGANKTITVPITHFTDFSFISRFRLKPSEATIRPGESVIISLVVDCKEQGLLDKLLRKPEDCASASPQTMHWNLNGPGGMEELKSTVGVYYIAPAKKPADNIAWVKLTITFVVYQLQPAEANVIERQLFTKITIQDRAYEAKGQTARLVFSGVICSLDQPFTVSGQSMLSYTLNFTPSSRTGGSLAYTASGYGVTATGSGTYTVEGIDSDHPKINIPPSSVTGTAGGRSVTTQAIPASIDLIPLENTECREG